jgi:uncharacterized membrane protein YoaK (UPF0700 family)
MSGNTTQLSIALGDLDWSSAAPPLLLVALFVAGAFTGTLVAALMKRWHLVCGFMLEALLLGAALWLSIAQAHPVMALAPLPIAMGLQNATARSMSKSGVGITFVTGTLTRLGECLAEAAIGRGGQWLTPALTWLALAAGAIGGAVVESMNVSVALLVPASCFALAVALAARQIIETPLLSPGTPEGRDSHRLPERHRHP